MSADVTYTDVDHTFHAPYNYLKNSIEISITFLFE